MDGEVQQKLVRYLEGGGNLLLYGAVPLYDMEGKACTILADALGLRPAETRRSTRSYFLSVYADGWFAPRPEVPTHIARVFEPSRGEVLLRVVGTNEACGFDIEVGRGRAVVLTAAYKCDVEAFRTILERLGAKAALRHDHAHGGVFMTSSRNKEGERFLHLINFDGYDKELHVTEEGRELFEGHKVVLRSRDALMLPLNVTFGDVKIAYATVEVARVERDALEFRLTHDADVIAFETEREIVESDEYDVAKSGKTTLVTSRKHAAVDNKLVVRWR
jgi:beta-galactosidase